MSKSKRGYVNDPEEVVKTAKAGLEKHRANGNVVELPSTNESVILDPQGNPIDQSGMRAEDEYITEVLIAFAIHAMSEGEFHTWWDCLETLREILPVNGWTHERMMSLFQQIEVAAIEDSDDENLGVIARTWLRQTKQELLDYSPVWH